MTGFINVDKAAGATSAQEVNKIKRVAGVPCGHMGTLDPMATGVLPVAIGNAARLFDYFLGKTKKYIAEFVFGSESDTLDSTGTVFKKDGRIPEEEEIKGVLGEFIGEINQIPPKYSAKNFKGQRGYSLARRGVEFELPPKKVKIYSLEFLGRTSRDSYSFGITCGGGTYIRSLARDIAAKLGTCALMSGLVRTESGPFKLENSVKTEAITADNLENYIIPAESVLDMPCVYPDARQAKKIFNGLHVESNLTDGTYKIYDADGLFYGLAEVKKGFLKAVTKLC